MKNASYKGIVFIIYHYNCITYIIKIQQKLSENTILNAFFIEHSYALIIN